VSPTAARPPGRPATDDPGSWGWHLVRASAWALVVLLPMWVVSVHLVGDASTVNATRLEVRWSSPVLRAFDWAVLVLALVHGALGTAGLLRSARPGNDGRRLVVGALYVVTALLVVALTATAFTYGLT